MKSTALKVKNNDHGILLKHIVALTEVVQTKHGGYADTGKLSSEKTSGFFLSTNIENTWKKSCPVQQNKGIKGLGPSDRDGNE